MSFVVLAPLVLVLRGAIRSGTERSRRSSTKKKEKSDVYTD